jgi:Predicted SAM-dependent methyltransferase
MQAIYDELIPGKAVWDFCCDHGYLGIHALKSGQFPQIHFVDQASHLVHRLENLWREKRHESPEHVNAYFHPYSGEKVLNEIHGTAVIAGVGAHTILQIVEEVMAKNLLKADRLILCAQRDEELLVVTFASNTSLCSAYNCTKELSVLERGRIRKLLIFDRKGT